MNTKEKNIVNQESTGKPVSFSINTEEIEQYLSDSRIKSVIDKIKSSYPFTFIGKQKFQRDIDSIELEFWLKNESAQYSLANKSFSKNFGIKLNQIIGKTAQDIYNVINREIISSVDEFIRKTSRAVVFQFDESGGNKKSYLQIPLNDLDGNVVAIIGFSIGSLKDSGEIKIKHERNTTKVNEFSEDLYFILDPDDVVLEISRKFCDHFELGISSDSLVEAGQIIPEVIHELFSINRMKIENESYFHTKFELGMPKPGEYDFTAKKYVENNEVMGYYIHVNQTIDQKENSELKSKMYDIIMHTSPEPMLIYDIENLKFIEVNHAALKLYGYTRDEFLQMDLTDLYAPEDIQTLIDSSPSKTTTSEFTGPWRHKHKNGNTLLVEISKSTLEYDGKKAHFNIIREVTKEIEKKKEIQSLKSIYANTRDIIIDTDSDGFIISYNEVALKKLKYEKSDLDNKPFLSMVNDSDRANINADIFHSDERNLRKFNTRIKKKNGDLVDAELVATPIINYENQIESFTILIQTKEEASVSTPKSAASDSKSSLPEPSFLSNLFHELLTPINVIMGFTQEITESLTKPSEEQKESIAIIKDNQKLLLQIMDNAVEYSNIEQNKSEVNPQEVTFVEIVEDIEENIKKDIEAKEIGFAYGKISSSLKLETDRSKISTLTTLLVRFAVQATDKKKIYLSAYALDNDHCIISIKDERVNITPELVEKMEEILTSDENIVKQKYGISRFTLRLARKLINLLGGQKLIYPDSDAPSEYGIKLPFIFPEREIVVEKPVAVVEEPKTKTIDIQPEEIREVTSNEPRKESQSQSVNVNVNFQPSGSDKQPTVEKEIKPIEEKRQSGQNSIVSLGPKELKELACLYVEDQVDSQILFKVQMKDLKMVEFANSFEKALPMLQTRSYDFIVMDINLQGEYNGLDALRAIQKMPGFERMPIIAVTAYVLPGDREKFIAAGFIDFITKPILKDKLETVLNKIFS